MSIRIKPLLGRLLLFVIFILCFSSCAEAQTLFWLYHTARSGEPTYLGAKADVLAARARKDQAFGGLLPQVQATASTNQNDRKYDTRNPYIATEKDNYNNHSGQIKLTQPLLRHANKIGVEQTSSIVSQSEYRLIGTSQDLFVKLAQIWLGMLSARDEITFTQRQAEAVRHQFIVIQQGIKFGLYGEPELEEARARLQQATADVMVAEAEMLSGQAALEQLVGFLEKLHLPYLYDETPLVILSEETFQRWLTQANSTNPHILAARHGYDAASAEVRKQRAGHLPTVDLVAVYSRNSQQVGGFPGQDGYDITQRSIGLEVNVPIFTGGTQSARVSEAAAQQAKARSELESAHRAATMNAKQAWFAWDAARARTQAGKQMIVAAESSLEFAKQGRESGLRMQLDILQAEQQLLRAQRDYRKGRYDQLMAYIRFLSATGTLTEARIRDLDSLFDSNPPPNVKMVTIQ